MGKLVASEMVSLDGVMESPNSFAFPYASEDGTKAALASLEGADALLLGRVTYQGFARAWPAMQGTGAYGEKMNSLPKFVFSHSLKSADWGNTTVLRGTLANEVAQLKSRFPRDVLVLGSGRLVRSLLAQGLLEELRLQVYPVTLGKGDRLFSSPTDVARFDLLDSSRTSSGVVFASYRPRK